MSTARVLGDFPTLFMAFWLTGWSVGVAVIQGMVLGANAFGMSEGVGLGQLIPLVFLVTHGGSEVFVQAMFSQQLRGNAENPSQVQATQDVGGQVVTWRRGSPSVIQWLATYLIPAGTLLILISPTLFVLSGSAGLVSSILSLLFAAAWIGIMGWLWLPTWQAQARSTDRIGLRVHAHGVTLVERTSTGQRDQQFAAHSLEVTGHSGSAQHRLTAGEVGWQGRLPPQAWRLLNESQPLFLQAREALQGAEVPEELARLRGVGAREGG